MEVWKDVEGLDGKYQISNYSRARSIDRYVNCKNGSLALKKGQLLKADTSTGYERVNIGKWESIHRLVAFAFIDNPNLKPQVNHINGIKTDNRIENLEWVTASENQIHAFKQGLTKKVKGENHFFSKLKTKQVLEIRNSILKQRELAEIYNVSQTSIGNIKNRKTWKF